MQKPSRFDISFLVIVLALFGTSHANSQTFATTAGSLALPLAYQTATPLQDGTVLIAGGDNDAGITATAEIYNPSTGTFVPTGSMNIARYSATATPLADGTVLIAGGSGDGSAEIYSGGTFSKLSATMTAVRYNATATLLQDGTVLIAGGDTGNWAGATSAEIYNPVKHTFTATTGSMSTRRTCHTATLLPDGTVLIAGGQGNYSGQTAWSTAEIYNPSTQQFTTVGNMTSARYYHTATLLTDGTVLLAGGHNNQSQTVVSSAEIYTPSSKSFAATGSMHYSRYLHTATALDDGTVLVAGGSNSSSVLSSAEVYTPSSKSFASVGNLTSPRKNYTATLLATGNVLLTGGLNGQYNPAPVFLSSAELYSYPVTTSVVYPAYKVTSIIYAPPGNKSQDGYTDTTSNGTTTTIGQSFTNGSSLSTSFGFKTKYVGGSASESFGTSSTTSNSSAFTETFTDATGVANQNASTSPDAINHNQDIFLIWLNPQLTVIGNSSAPVSYSVGVQPVANGATPLADILEVSANVMEANSAGMTTVPFSLLNRHIDEQTGQYVPGLASICKNLIASEYAAGTCTLADQCGCKATDFLPILQADPLLFYNGLDNPISPYPATVSPLEANTSSGSLSDANCGTLPLPNPTESSCRYVPVPSAPGSTTKGFTSLYGPESQGGNNIPNSFQQGENSQIVYTQGGQTQSTATNSFQENLGPVLTWGQSYTTTWTDSQSTGTSSGSGVTQAVSLSSYTVGCAQVQDVGVFEDTVYHTFVFQQPPDDPSTCTALTPAFSITATPNNPNQTALSLGHSMSITVNVSAWNGFSGTVALSIVGLPQGVTASFSPSSVTTSTVASATLTLAAAYSSSTYIGSSAITVKGTSGGTAQSAIFTLTTRPLQYKGTCGVQ